jgi:hypothetical protein
MKTIAVAVLAFLLGILASFVWIHQSKVLAENPPAQATQNTKQPAPCAQWVTLPDGTKVLRVWENLGPDWPQIALLQMSSDLHTQFEKDASGYVNSQKIFPKDVQPKAKTAQAEKVPASYHGVWIKACTHHPGSAMACTSFAADEVKK